MTVAALYVAPGGVYYGLPDVEPWGLPERDAREYAGPHSVVAHPPCERWGSYWSGGPLLVGRGQRKALGDDGGCFFAALAAVRSWGGVLEHPAYSRAWKFYGIARPPREGEWVAAGDGIGWTCHVEQGHYGHRAPKATWLYAARVEVLPVLAWGKSGATALVSGVNYDGRPLCTCVDPTRPSPFCRTSRHGPRHRMPDRERKATPPAFRDLLLSIARSASAGRRAA